ncbi:BTB/POZ and MATH domain-containing protein 3-like [Papaver somniferum]|uniref:BTB/POZ and MATH domain-containing protein 3-like n=1 Tax=Papaver somniferum TaxID=3469 RepID=UPI000E6F6783|nr:BTB/POZ and MATH domain-containing protein 3-like [Papaver somniferum]
MALKRPRASNSNTKNDHEMSTSRWIHETVKGSHEFKIKGYSLAKGMGVGKYMASGKFTVGGHEWVVHFYPNGNTEASKEYVSVFLKLISPGQEVRVLYEFKLLDQSSSKYGVHYVSPEPPMTGWNKYTKRSEFETSSYLKDDCLTIHCTVRVVQTHVETLQTRVEEGQQYVIPVPPSDLSQNLKGLPESGVHSDITFQVGDKSFKAHKSIIAARCPPLDTETVAIEEFDPFAFKAMLLFLYSDELPEPRELSDLDPHCTSTTIIQHLLVAADRFVLARLKLMCEAKLCEQIAANTVATILALADHHQCLQLKTACLNFAAKPENSGEVIKSAGLARLEKNNPSLVIELLKARAVADEK